MRFFFLEEKPAILGTYFWSSNSPAFHEDLKLWALLYEISFQVVYIYNLHQIQYKYIGYNML